MKRNENFILRQVVDTWVVVPVGEAAAQFHGMIQLNESGAMLWRALEQGEKDAEALTQLLLSQYAVSREEAQADVEAFTEKLIRAGCLL